MINSKKLKLCSFPEFLHKGSGKADAKKMLAKPNKF
jgi:hypothetical protein